MKKQKKNNNKGFSLVELIVVVLIMAIIAIALAPAVMKWVDNSRLATDVQTYDGMYADAQLAMVNKAALAAVKGGEYKIQITDQKSVIIDKDGDVADAGDAVYDAMTAVDPSWASAKAKAPLDSVAGRAYTITLNTSGAAIRTTPPDTSTNADLN